MLHRTLLHPFLNKNMVAISYKEALRIRPIISSKNSTFLGENKRNFHRSNICPFNEDRNTKTLSLLNNVKEVKSAPPAALVLGLSGLAPFVAPPMYMISQSLFLPHVAFAQLAYGVVILSFIGGIRWGLTLPDESLQRPDWHNLGYSVSPSLVAWGGILMSPTIGTLTVIVGLALTGYMDIAMWGYPNWFKGLRFCLTFIAIMSLWTTLMCKAIMNGDKDSVEKVETKDS